MVLSLRAMGIEWFMQGRHVRFSSLMEEMDDDSLSPDIVQHCLILFSHLVETDCSAGTCMPFYK
jgi:hypothetical protein